MSVMATLCRKQFVPTVTFTPGAPADGEMMISTEAVDREGDRVIAAGADLDAFRRNPVLLWAHSLADPPIGTVTGLEIQPGRGLRARWRWAEGDAVADRIRNLWDQGILRSASIGFLPVESVPNEFGGRDFLRWELAELSLCSVPANREAVRQLKQLAELRRAGPAAARMIEFVAYESFPGAPPVEEFDEDEEFPLVLAHEAAYPIGTARLERRPIGGGQFVIRGVGRLYADRTADGAWQEILDGTRRGISLGGTRRGVIHCPREVALLNTWTQRFPGARVCFAWSGDRCGRCGEPRVRLSLGGGHHCNFCGWNR
jgi:HK97 family phage prohead protease